MILIADSGSTKTDWALIENSQLVEEHKTMGCNPYYLSPAEILHQFTKLSAKLGPKRLDAIYFYGAGCTPGEKSDIVSQALSAAFGSDVIVEVNSDMLGAARALCQREEGIACILGTGSNSCLYDGSKITANVSPLGFILGDEGSGAVLGKMLVGNVLKDQFSPQIKTQFLNFVAMDAATIINKVYREPLPNRFLASLSLFVHAHLHDEQVRAMAQRCFLDFFERNVLNYQRKDLAVGLVGSVAYHYQSLIKDVAETIGLKLGRILQSPIQGLVQYHTN